MSLGPDEVKRNPAAKISDHKLRPYASRDENSAIALWLRTWQAAYPQIDFAARLDWWRERWNNELVPNAAILVAEANDAMVGFVTVDPRTRYLDQIVVAPERWGSGAGAALHDGSQAHLAGGPRPRRQHRQRTCHPVLR